jgi:hypothetical protein
MNDQTGRNRGPRRAGALAVAAAIAVLAAACGGGSAPPSASAPTYAQVLALAQCMRSHGGPDFARGLGGQSPALGNKGAINPNSPQFQAALAACQHLLPPGAHISIHMSRTVSRAVVVVPPTGPGRQPAPASAVRRSQ